MKGIRVLLIDDEEEFRKTLATRLRIRNLEITEAGSGPAAIEAMTKEVFDVVVLDLRMPGMDGIDTLKRLKKVQPRAEVIMLTGHASVETGIDGMKLGAFDYLMKPCDIDELISKIQSACKKKKKVIHL